jgi:hypothetical protein
VKKRLCVVLLSVVALLGVGGGVGQAKATTSPGVPTSANAAAPACLKVYLVNFGFCWYGLH